MVDGVQLGVRRTESMVPPSPCGHWASSPGTTACQAHWCVVCCALRGGSPSLPLSSQITANDFLRLVHFSKLNTRRRGMTLGSSDSSVQDTNDDAQVSKLWVSSTACMPCMPCSPTPKPPPDPLQQQHPPPPQIVRQAGLLPG